MKVFYRPEQVGPAQHSSPSAHKPRLVVQDWNNRPDIDVEICRFEPVTEAQLSAAHHPDYVRGVLDGTIANGFGNRDPRVAASLPYTSGSLLGAAEYAVLHQDVVCSPTSGFHHAEYRHGGGYCTFNGLMVTAIALKNAAMVDRVAILDCDAHYGNGTDSIIRALDINWIAHHTQGRSFHTASDVRDGRYEAWLERAIEACRGCDLVLYQAGADPHIHDPLGGMLTTGQMSQRDRAVFEGLGHLPMVWNLAGGYQTLPGSTEAERIEPVLALHRETARLHGKILQSMPTQGATL